MVPGADLPVQDDGLHLGAQAGREMIGKLILLGSSLAVQLGKVGSVPGEELEPVSGHVSLHPLPVVLGLHVVVIILLHMQSFMNRYA